MRSTEKIGGYPVHPVAAKYPLLPESEMAVIVKDMEENGFDKRRPVELWEGQVVDGRNRLTAAIRAGVEPVFTELTFEDENAVAAYITRVNDNRRHMTPSQKAAVAAEIARLTGTSLAKAASVAGVSEATVDRFRRAEKIGGQEAVEAIRNGEMTASEAIREYSPPKPKTPPPASHDAIDEEPGSKQIHESVKLVKMLAQCKELALQIHRMDIRSGFPLNEMNADFDALSRTLERWKKRRERGD